MKLERMSITAARPYQDWQGYRGEITFDGDLGKVQIQVGDELSREIVRVCAKQIVAASRAVANEITAEVLEQATSPAIERLEP